MIRFDDSRCRSSGCGSIDRRQFLELLGSGAVAAGLGGTFAGCRSPSSGDRKVVVLGLDGLDPTIVQFLIDAGRAPNFKRLAELGSFARLGTTMPALSPVAWSTFITGVSPGTHGIADFIVRDPQTYLPKFSIYEVEETGRVLNLGDYQFPLGGGDVVNLRRGRTFWSYLTERGIPAVVTKIPTNFPVDQTATRAVSGMGTPDLADTYGMFNYFTTDEFEVFPGLSGGRVHYVEVRDHRVTTELVGPENNLRRPRNETRDPYVNHVRVPLTIYRDPVEQAVLIEVQNHSFILRKGEYSDWVELDFELLPVLGSAAGIVRFLLKEAHPHLRLYATPININAADQAMPVTHPVSYGEELTRDLGPFWTKGLPCDTKAFDYGVLTDEEYVGQAELILRERLALFEYEWSRFRSGLFFFYVSSTDQDAHMLWRNMDADHPKHKESDVRFGGWIHHLYEEMDKLVGRVLPALDDNTLLLICSDHGFAQFGRQFHLNTWLRDRGYLTLKPGSDPRGESSILDVDWRQTMAYGMGFNGLYVNLKNREKQGIVEPEKVPEFVRRISGELEEIVDPETGRRPVARVYRRDEVYSGDLTPTMPEMLVGYSRGFRSSSASVLGATGNAILDVNPWAWSGDHSMARDLVPGSLFSSRKLVQRQPNIIDLPVTILDFFGIQRPEHMQGRSLLGS